MGSFKECNRFYNEVDDGLSHLCCAVEYFQDFITKISEDTELKDVVIHVDDIKTQLSEVYKVSQSISNFLDEYRKNQ